MVAQQKILVIFFLLSKYLVDLLPAAAEATPLMGKYFPSLNKTALNTSDIRPTKNWNQKNFIHLQLQLVWLGVRWLISSYLMEICVLIIKTIRFYIAAHLKK